MHPLVQLIKENDQKFREGKITSREALSNLREVMNSKCSSGLARRLTVREVHNSNGDVLETALGQQVAIWQQ